MTRPEAEGAAPAHAGGWRLADSPSPYLQMHAHNPVEWHAWGEDAFARARRENKPIFLSIGYSTCYWCHVMERESFQDAAVARALSSGFVSIKLDREARPDVDDLYMTAVMIMQGRGGWPMSVFLTPDLQPFFAGTYFPRADFLGLLEQVAKAWAGQRDALVQQAQRVTDAVARSHAAGAAAELPGMVVVDAALQELRTRYDPVDGGFDGAPKFPMPAQLELLLHRLETAPDRDLLSMLTHTLTRMAQGGIHDQLGGGFHRYATDAHWQVPHFEKMLYDNAQLLRVYAQAYRLTGDAIYARVAEDIVALLDAELGAPDGLCYSAIDAETEAEEGRYYVWTRDELRAALTEEEWRLAEQVWGLDRPPNFEHGRYVLAWPADYRATAAALGLDLDALFQHLEGVRAKLRQARARRPAPLVDQKILVGWNGLTLDALAYAGVVLQRPDWIARARRAAEALCRQAQADTGLRHMLRDGKSHGDAVLEDYAALLLGLTAIAQASSDEQIWAQAGRLADQMLARLWDAGGGGFYDAQTGAEGLLLRPRSRYDGAIPSGNSLAARALLRLWAQGQERYRQPLAATLSACGSELARQPAALTAMVTVLAQYHAQVKPTDSASKIEASLSGIGSARVLRLKIAPGWHLNAHAASPAFLLGTEVLAERDDRPIPLDVDYPAGERLDTGLAEGPSRVYSGELTITLEAKQGGSLAGAILRVRVQACGDDGVCLAPAEVQLKVV